MFQSVSCLICKQGGKQGHELQRGQPQGGVTDDWTLHLKGDFQGFHIFWGWAI